MNKKSDYDVAIENAIKIPKFYLGQEVETPYGIGVIVDMKMDYNGLYISPENASVVVWYSCDSRNGKISWQYKLSEISSILSSERNIKLESIINANKSASRNLK